VFLAAWILFFIVAFGVLLQTGVAVTFVARLVRFRQKGGESQPLPKAAVVLAVRGPDPYLEQTIRRLLDQDYPCFAIHIVLDSQQDPALDVIRRVIEGSDAQNVSISLLRQPKPTCSLKCSSLLQAVEDLGTEFEVLAFTDGDALPYRSWLRDLVVPLRDPSVGVTTGNRWYMPETANWGSLVRYFWNAGAVVQVWFNGIVWAGSMAMRTDVIRKVGLLEAWSSALSVDATVHLQMRKHGRRVRFVPSAMLVNTESTSFGEFARWVQRQMVAAKFCRKGWSVVTFHTVWLTSIQCLPAAGVIWALAAGNLIAAGVFAGSVLFLWLVSLATSLIIEGGVRRVVSSHGRQCAWLSASMLLRMFPALVFTYAVYPCIFAKAIFCSRVPWRGIEYEIIGPGRIRMVEYRPFEAKQMLHTDRSVV
jgi:cellulose synthase/poly-beta-1,6-N-acetylglucosamine synthase-like glycosyltransferase